MQDPEDAIADLKVTRPDEVIAAETKKKQGPEITSANSTEAHRDDLLDLGTFQSNKESDRPDGLANGTMATTTKDSAPASLHMEEAFVNECEERDVDAERATQTPDIAGPERQVKKDVFEGLQDGKNHAKEEQQCLADLPPPVADDHEFGDFAPTLDTKSKGVQTSICGDVGNSRGVEADGEGDDNEFDNFGDFASSIDVGGQSGLLTDDERHPSRLMSESLISDDAEIGVGNLILSGEGPDGDVEFDDFGETTSGHDVDLIEETAPQAAEEISSSACVYKAPDGEDEKKFADDLTTDELLSPSTDDSSEVANADAYLDSTEGVVHVPTTNVGLSFSGNKQAVETDLVEGGSTMKRSPQDDDECTISVVPSDDCVDMATEEVGSENATGDIRESASANDPQENVEGSIGFGEAEDFGDFMDVQESPDESNSSPFEHASDGTFAGHDTNLEKGDFSGFSELERSPSLSTAAAEETLVSDDENDEFGDFSDFNEAPPASSDDHYGDEGRDVAKGTSGGPGVIASPVLQKAEDIFYEIFTGDLSETTEGEHQVDERNALRIETLMALLSEQRSSEAEPSLSETALRAVLWKDRGMIGAANPNVVVHEDSVYPYDHYSFPTSRLPYEPQAPSKKRSVSLSFPTTELEATRAAEKSYSIQARNDSMGETPTMPSSSATIVSLPPRTGDLSSTPAGNGTSDPVSSLAADIATTSSQSASTPAKRFLQQIPDLSFMLHSTLSLPKKS